MEVKWPHTSVVRASVMFGCIVPEIFLSGVVINFEQFLCLMAQQPEIPHIHRPRSLTLDGIGGDAHRRAVIAMDGGGWLGMSHLLKGESHNFCFKRVEEKGAEFGFGRGCGDTFQDGAIGEDGAIEANGAAVFRDGAEEAMS